MSAKQQRQDYTIPKIKRELKQDAREKVLEADYTIPKIKRELKLVFAFPKVH